MRNTRLIVDLDKFKNNIDKIKKYVGNKIIIPVIKANGYGTYINKRIDIINNFEIVAVALVEEAIEIRDLGYKGDILVLNQPINEEIDSIIKYNISVGICSFNFLEEIVNKNASVKIHLEIETGMNRTGINVDEISKFINLVKNSNLIFDGIYSHFSSVDFDAEYTEKQISIFRKAVSLIKSLNINPKYIHISASSGIIKYNDLDFVNAVRPGIIMYGYEPFENSNNYIKVEPICKLVSSIVFIKKVKKGDAISYGQKYICDDDKIIATIPIGYADGYRRDLTNKGYVFINGFKAPIVGTVCMDSIMVDITSVDAKIGDEVIIFDNENIKLEELANIFNTINYEILSNISYRVPRKFIKN